MQSRQGDNCMMRAVIIGTVCFTLAHSTASGQARKLEFEVASVEDRSAGASGTSDQRSRWSRNLRSRANHLRQHHS